MPLRFRRKLSSMTRADPGFEAIDALYKALMVDPEWSERRARSFTWWPHRFAQRIWAAEPFEEEGVVSCSLHAETEILRAGAGVPRLNEKLADLMRFPPMAAFVRVSGELRLWSSVTVDRERAPFLIPRLAVAATLQATYAELGMESLTQATGLLPAFSAHPRSGARERPDELLRLAAERIVPEGNGPSRWRDGAEFAPIAAELVQRGARAVAEPRGVNARFPFRQGASDPLAPSFSSLLQLRIESHPELGSGIFIRLFLPTATAPEPDGLASVALRLNDLERAADGFAPATLGSWCLEKSEPEIAFDVLPAPARLAHVSFLPNVLYAPNTLRNMAIDSGRRALWAAHVLGHAPSASDVGAR